MLEEYLNALPLTFIPLFVAVDVFWALCLFAPYVEQREEAEVKAIARMATLTALAVSLAFTAVGAAIFSVLGISVNDFKVAGGLLLLILSINDILNPNRSTLFSGDEAAVVPLGVPLIVGPAVLTTILILVEHYGPLPTLTSLLANLFISWLLLRKTKTIFKHIPRAHAVAVSKILAILLASIAVMMIRVGLTGILK